MRNRDLPRTPGAMCGLALFCLLAASTARADITMDAYYRGELWYNSSGGVRTGSDYVDDAGLQFSADLPSLFGNSEATLFAYLLYNNHSAFSEKYVGDLQVISNIDAPNALRVLELWVEQPWDERYSLRFGLYDLNSEFDAVDTSALFLNSSHGIGAAYGQTGIAGPSIFPLTSLTARFEWQLTAADTLRYAILDAVPGDPDDPQKTTIRLSSSEGVLHAMEYNHVFAGGARVGVGGWAYSGRFDRIEGDLNGLPLRDDGNRGLYGFIDLPVLSDATAGIDVHAFLRYGNANDALNALDAYFGGGLVVSNLLDARPADVVGVSFASARAGDPFRRVSAAAGMPLQRAETSIELTYGTQLTPWLWLQPDIQYVINPGVNPALDNALVFGLRFELTASRHWP